MTLRCSGVVSEAMIGPRVPGSAAPQWIGIGLAPPAPGCEVSLMCLDLCLLAIARSRHPGRETVRLARRQVGVKQRAKLAIGGSLGVTWARRARRARRVQPSRRRLLLARARRTRTDRCVALPVV